MNFDTRPACYAVVMRGDTVLLTHYATSRAEGWTLPGGGMEPHESPVECVQREVFEETGYRVSVSGVAAVHHDWISAAERWSGPSRDLLTLGLVYWGEIVGGALEPEADGSTDDARWVPLAELDAHADQTGWPATAVREVLARMGKG